MNENLVNAILVYSECYRIEQLIARYDPGKVLTDWWDALELSFRRACDKGRSGIVSQLVYAAVVDVTDAIIVIIRVGLTLVDQV